MSLVKGVRVVDMKRANSTEERKIRSLKCGSHKLCSRICHFQTPKYLGRAIHFSSAS